MAVSLGPGLERYEVWIADGKTCRGSVTLKDGKAIHGWPLGHIESDELRPSNFRTVEERLQALEAAVYVK